LESPAASAGETITKTLVGMSGSPGGGPYIILELTVVGQVIQSVATQSNGCPAAITCSSLTARLITNRTIEQAARLEATDLLLILKDFEGPKDRYAPMAVEALINALEQVK